MALDPEVITAIAYLSRGLNRGRSSGLDDLQRSKD
jgi:hypothetical protein